MTYHYNLKHSANAVNVNLNPLANTWMSLELLPA